MSSQVYKPTTENGQKAKYSHLRSVSSEPRQDDDADTLCGLGGFTPKFLQYFAKIQMFTGFYSLAALTTSTLSVYINSQVTTLERQFGFSSRQTGLLMAANDMGYLSCVLFVSYLATRVHVPRFLGWGTVLFGMSGLLCCLPHFLYGVKNDSDAAFENTTSSLTTTESESESIYGDLCHIHNYTADACDIEKESSAASKILSRQEVGKASLIIIFIGMIVQGLGKAPRMPLTVMYVDSNADKIKTGFYFGIIASLAIFGPALAFVMGGYFSKLYVTLKPTNLTPRHPEWIGAWWLGFLVFGLVAIASAIPIFCFPKRMPDAGNRKSKEENDSELDKATKAEQECYQFKTDNSAQEQQSTSLEKPSCGTRTFVFIKDFIQTMLRIWSSPVCMLMIASNCFAIFHASGHSAYGPKYMEKIFDLPTYKANYFLAGETLCSACLGIFLGGYLTKRFRMTALKALKFIVVVILISLLINLTGFIFYCEQPQTHNRPGSAPACSSDCACPDHSYFPVCGGDGLTYYSPCAAGCQQGQEGTYSNCTCIPGGEAVSGSCSYSCGYLYPYIASNALRSLLGTVSIMPKTVVVIRSVSDKDKSMAIGFNAFSMSLLGWLLGPIAFGYIIDGMCSIWSVTCGVTGHCMLYDNQLFRVKYMGYCSGALTLSLVCLILAYVYALKTKCLEGPLDEKETTKELEIARNGQVELPLNDVGKEQVGYYVENGELKKGTGEADRMMEV